MQNENKLFSTANLAKIGILGAFAFVVMRVLEIPMPIFPTFLKIDFGDIPAVIATLVVHPMAGIVVVLIKNLLALFNSSSGGVGEIANLFVGMAFILPIALMTRKNSKLSNIILGSIMGIGLMIIAGMLTNAYIMLPLYGEEACIGAGAAINPRIVDRFTYLIYIIAPFNLVKGSLVATVSVVVVKAMKPMFKYLRPRHSSAS